ncbi:hypothetical protein H671_6g16998 [Cricetulus griseus]|nr:hypothetical protein H671_6g16998 [Cricetulus griseus]
MTIVVTFQQEKIQCGWIYGEIFDPFALKFGKLISNPGTYLGYTLLAIEYFLFFLLNERSVKNCVGILIGIALTL